MRTILIIVISFICLCIPSKADILRKLDLNNGLSHLSVMSISQDTLGRMWFGTTEGLNVYDGQRIKSYKGWVFDEYNNSIWLGNDIKSIYRGIDGNMYILSDKNLYKYDINKDCFIQLTTSSNITAANIYDNDIIFTKKDSLYIYKINSREINNICRIPSYAYTTILKTSDGCLYLGATNGLYILKKKDNVYDIEQVIKNINIYSLYESKNNDIWIGTRMQGLYRIKDNDKKIFKETEVDELQIREFVEDDHGNIWFGTFSGLQMYDSQTKRFSRLFSYVSTEKLNNFSIFSLYKDTQKLIWIGSYGAGVSFFNPNKNDLLHLDYQLYSKKNNLYLSYIRDIIIDKNKNLWMGTEGAGVTGVDENWNLIENFSSNVPNTISHNNIKTMSYDYNNNFLFIGTHLGGLYKYDITHKKIYNYKQDLKIFKGDNNIICSSKIKNGKLYFTTQQSLYVLDIATNEINMLIPDLYYCECFDLDKRNDNIYLIDKNDLKIFSQKEIKYIDNIKLKDKYTKGEISHIISADNGIYICTLGSGLLYYNKTSKSFVKFNMQNSQIPSDYCYNIEKYDDNSYIVITDTGISLFRPDLNSFSTINNDSRYPLVKGSGLCISSSYIYVGDIKGVTLIGEDIFKKNEDVDFNIYFSGLYINNQLITPIKDKEILEKNISFTKKITLQHNQNNCMFEFSHSNYKYNNYRELFEYKLEGFDNQWITASEQKIYYTYLKPGKYTLYVRPVNFPQKMISLDIDIKSPLYLSWFAICVYIFAFVFIIFYYIRNKIYRQKLTFALEKEKIEKKHIEEINNQKLIFFTNISHEFRTPLTLIINHIDSLLQNQMQVSLYNKIIKIKNNAQYMNNLVNELIDFRKFSQNHVTLILSEMDICKLVKEIYLSFYDYAKQNEIEYIYKAEKESIFCWIDKKQLEKVFFNILSNAFKYIGRGKYIHINISTDLTYIKIEFKDTGMGISREDLPKIFDRFYQVHGIKSNSYSSGIGLALTKNIIESHHGKITVTSEINRGSTFTVLLPLGKNEYLNDNNIQFSQTKYEENIIINNNKLFVENIVPDESPLLIKEGNNYKILLVEDNVEILNVLVEIFSPFYTVFTANDGEEGLQNINKYKPDIVVSDIMMPNMNGIDLCMHIKNNIDTCHIPVILLTALNSEEQNIEGLNRGADDYITKPFNAQLLLARTNNLVRNRLLIQNKLKNNPIKDVDLTSINPLDQDLLKRVSKAIEDHISDYTFDISSLCKEVGIGRSLLYTKFKALTGVTPNNYLLNYRLNNAVTLLKKYPDLPIADISERCGFNTPVYFSYCFKKMFGQTPQNYKKTINQNDSNY